MTENEKLREELDTLKQLVASLNQRIVELENKNITITSDPLGNRPYVPLTPNWKPVDYTVTS